MSAQNHRPFVPENAQLKEFSVGALVLGLVMCVVLGAANAYLGLRAGMTIAATYPAAVISMAVVRMWKGSILEENIARTAGSIGESVAAGAVFTLPAFLIAGSWTSFDPHAVYWKSTALMVTGSVLGVLFVSLVRRVLVEDPSLPFPESVAASQIHKAGQQGAQAAKYLFWNIGARRAGAASGRDAALRRRQKLLRAHRRNRQKLPSAGTYWQREAHRHRRHHFHRCAHRQPCLHGRRLCDRPDAGRAQFLRRSAGLGRSGSAVHVLPGTRNCNSSCLRARPPATPIGRTRLRPSGATSCGRSPWEECWWARPTRSSRWAATSAPASAARSSEVRHGTPPMESLKRTERYMGSKTVFALDLSWCSCS